MTVLTDRTSSRCAAAPIRLDALRWHEVTEPRRLQALLPSIEAHGVVEPIHVVAHDEGWIIVDGAHRARVATLLGHDEVPAHVFAIDDAAPIAGWTHGIPAASGRRLRDSHPPRSHGARVVACLRHDGEVLDLTAQADDLCAPCIASPGATSPAPTTECRATAPAARRATAP